MSNTDTLVGMLDGIGDAIRAKTGGSAKLSLADMPDEIASIGGGGGGFDWSQMATLTSRTAPHFSKSATSLDLTGIDTSRAVWFDYMFYGMTSLRSVDLSPLNGMGSALLSRRISFSSMFENSGMRTIDLTPLDMTDVYATYNMFSGCNSLQTLKTPASFGIGVEEGNEATFPVAMTDENGNQFSAGDIIPNGAHTYTAV